MPNTLEIDAVSNAGQGDEHLQRSSSSSSSSISIVASSVVAPGMAINERIPASENLTLRVILDAAESEAIQRALQHTGWNRKRAAQLLKISYRGLLYKIRNHSITPPLAGD